MLTFSHDSLGVLASPRAVLHIVNPPNWQGYSASVKNGVTKVPEWSNPWLEVEHAQSLYHI